MNRKKSKKKSDEEYWRGIKKAVDEGHRYFWRKRGLDAPPASSYNLFGDWSKTGRKSQSSSH